ncbi:Nn.00g105720.m01.CDS01 [Neocucurbitaria sp. VM-36]
MATNSDSPVRPEKRRRLERVTAACDLCKKRKVKCDGTLPCAYCKRKNLAATCKFTAPGARSQLQSAGHTLNSLERDRSTETPRSRQDQNEIGAAEALHDSRASLSPTVSRDDRHEDTVVPLEGRILRDAQGKFIFIGDCAPLSFLQTVRYLIASEVDPEGLPIHAVRDSIIEVAPQEPVGRQRNISVNTEDIRAFVEEYAVATSGLVDMFQHDELLSEMMTWANGLTSHSDDTAAAVFYLVLAVGAQESREDKAAAWFGHARELLLKHMCNSMNVSTVQGFILVAIFMLRAFQPNGAYLYFSLAARTAYAIGIHRTEVNASFGDSIKTIRDRIWKSLRVVDMLISNVLGRPPSTSDVDCTVKYRVAETDSQVDVNILDASVQIFMIIERVVVEVYSRKRISLRIADYVSRQLKTWASKWLRKLTEIAARGISSEIAVGACSTLCSYYYGIMLLTRPFLIYELYEYMGASLKGGGSQSDHQNKRKYADAALDAATTFVETLQAVIHAGRLPRRMPLIVPWLFTTSLVLAVGILGRSGLTVAEHCKASIRCLDYFSEVDPTARQYSLIVQSMLKITTSHVNKRELHLRLQRKQASSHLFGLLSSDVSVSPPEQRNDRSGLASGATVPNALEPGNVSTTTPLDWTIYDADFFALPWTNESDQGLQDFLQPSTMTLDGASIADIPLFPIYDQQERGGFL